jgi:hypothetical protein
MKNEIKKKIIFLNIFLASHYMCRYNWQQYEDDTRS